VVKWWVNSGLELKYTDSVLKQAFRNGHTEILKLLENVQKPKN